MQKIKSISAIALVLISVVGFISCNSEQATKASATGSPNEIIVVAEDNLWKTSLGDSIKNFFGSSRTGLPQDEPLYKVVQIKLSEFNRIFETHRNVLAITIDSSLSEPKTEMVHNVWSAPQRVVKIAAPSVEMLKTAFNEKKREIFNLYENAEIKRQQDLYAKTLNIKAGEIIREKFNLKMAIPADYFVAVNKDNFLWLRKEANIISQGILIYSYPYTDTASFDPRKILSVRNQFTRLYVPGPTDSSFMVVAENYVTPVNRVLTLKKELAVEIRGLWEVEKDFMGGPFVSYTLVDQKNNMVITLDGYVYAPNKNKADLLRQVQSILLSFEFVEK
jgi:hypothetical protein